MLQFQNFTIILNSKHLENLFIRKFLRTRTREDLPNTRYSATWSAKLGKPPESVSHASNHAFNPRDTTYWFFHVIFWLEFMEETRILIAVQHEGDARDALMHVKYYTRPRDPLYKYYTCIISCKYNAHNLEIDLVNSYITTRYPLVVIFT